jgi:DNA-binding transcriptional MocR family regulator
MKPHIKTYYSHIFNSTQTFVLPQHKYLPLRYFTAKTAVASSKMTKHNPASSPPKKQINFLRGWPNTSLLPTTQLQKASNRVYEDPSVSHPALLYGPDPGPQSLRESIAKWLRGFFSDYYDAPAGGDGEREHAERICITGGASQNLACLLQVYSDPVATTVWMVTPGYFLAGRIFDDSGLVVRAVGEGSEGVDLESLEKGLKEGRSNEGKLKVCEVRSARSRVRVCHVMVFLRTMKEHWLLQPCRLQKLPLEVLR